AARARLAREIAAAHAPRRRGRLRAAAPGPFALAAAAVCAIAVVGAIAPGGDEPRRGGAPAVPLASGAPLLLQAADRTRRADRHVTPPRGDQYVYTRRVIVETPIGGGPVERFVDEQWESVDGSRPSRSSERGRAWDTNPQDPSVGLPRRYEDLAALPTDGAELRAALVDRFGGPGISDAVDRETEYTALTFLLGGGAVMPPGLRAAMFEALAQIPGVEVVEDQVDALGRRGIGITSRRYHLSGVTILDPRTYEYLGMRDTLVRDDGVRVQQVMARTDRGVVDEIGQRP
ncbi:MAG TPA: CU044_5270 family protein, partial [Solirubrobacteraceae bacterium]|nr:CU044_5270 family protein [Solirubrobacteraceae bacterium]